MLPGDSLFPIRRDTFLYEAQLSRKVKVFTIILFFTKIEIAYFKGIVWYFRRGSLHKSTSGKRVLCVVGVWCFDGRVDEFSFLGFFG